MSKTLCVLLRKPPRPPCFNRSARILGAARRHPCLQLKKDSFGLWGRLRGLCVLIGAHSSCARVAGILACNSRKILSGCGDVFVVSAFKSERTHLACGSQASLPAAQERFFRAVGTSSWSLRLNRSARILRAGRRHPCLQLKKDSFGLSSSSRPLRFDFLFDNIEALRCA